MSTTLPPFKTVAAVIAWCEREQERRDGVDVYAVDVPLVTKALELDHERDVECLIRLAQRRGLPAAAWRPTRSRGFGRRAR